MVIEALASPPSPLRAAPERTSVLVGDEKEKERVGEHWRGGKRIEEATATKRARSRPVPKWSRMAVRVCDGWTTQNAAHVYQCPWVGDGIRRGEQG